MKILNESIQDVESYLQSDIVYDLKSTYGSDLSKYNDSEIIDYVIDQVLDNLGEYLSSEEVVACQVVGDEVNIIDPSQLVIVFNGRYYDYLAQKHNELFNNQIKINNLPVIQKVIRSDNQISERISTIKGYCLLGNV